MNCVSDYYVINFLEWLSSNNILDIINDASYENTGALKELAEIFLSEEYDCEEYLLKQINFEVKECCRRCRQQKENKNISSQDCHCRVHQAVHRVLDNHYMRQSTNDFRYRDDCDAETLVYTIYCYKKYSCDNPTIKRLINKAYIYGVEDKRGYDNGPMLGLMVMPKTKDYTILSFISWLHKYKKLDSIELDNETFMELIETYVKEFADEKNGQDITQSLSMALKDTNISKFIINKFKKEWAKMKNLSELTDRYLQAKYKIIVLSGVLDSLVKEHGEFLNSLTGNDLDIYYKAHARKDDLYKFAYNLGLKTSEVPCIVIWQNDIKKSKYIGIASLNAHEVFILVKTIVHGIQNKKSFKDIVIDTEKISNLMKSLNSCLESINVETMTEEQKEEIVELMSQLRDMTAFVNSRSASSYEWAQKCLGIGSNILSIIADSLAISKC